jgi:nucleoside-diphosphate-sugar epimerase
VEIATGDLGNPAAVDAAVRGARIVIHAGAAMSGGWISHRASTVVGTQNVIDACLRHGVQQLVYISSLSVVHWADGRGGEPISEYSPLEPAAEARGAYTRAKLEAELLVRKAVKESGLRAVILRPGQIFGGTLPLVSSAVARRVGRRHLVLGDGSLRLPLVHMDDVVDAICSAIDRRLVNGEIIQLVGSDLPTQNEILAHELGSDARIVRVPSWFLFGAGWLSELALKPVKRTSPLSRYRLRSALTPRKFASRNAEELLGWMPRGRVLQ